jgi:hypothetical protein
VRPLAVRVQEMRDGNKVPRMKHRKDEFLGSDINAWLSSRTTIEMIAFDLGFGLALNCN